jgi:hypothetical protein
VVGSKKITPSFEIPRGPITLLSAFINRDLKIPESESFMVRFFCWMCAVAIMLACGPYLGAVTLRLAKAAAHAHQFDQMSYAKFTHELINAKSRAAPKD